MLLIMLPHNDITRLIDKNPVLTYTEAEIQKLTDQYILKLDQHLAFKEKEILTV